MLKRLKFKYDYDIYKRPGSFNFLGEKAKSRTCITYYNVYVSSIVTPFQNITKLDPLRIILYLKIHCKSYNDSVRMKEIFPEVVNTEVVKNLSLYIYTAVYSSGNPSLLSLNSSDNSTP